MQDSTALIHKKAFVPVYQVTQHWDPLRDLMTLQERMNRLFEDASRGRGRKSHESEEQEIEHADWTPAADVYNLETEYVIMVDLPGIDRETLDISLEDDRLLIRGTRTIEHDRQQRLERSHGRFLRRFGPLPPAIDRQAITADYKDGVLNLRMPKRAERKSGRVEIKVS